MKKMTTDMQKSVVGGGVKCIDIWGWGWKCTDCGKTYWGFAARTKCAFHALVKH